MKKKSCYIPFKDEQRQTIYSIISKEVKLRMLNKSAPKEDVQKIIDKAIEQFVCHMTHLSEEKGVWSMEHSAVPVVVDCPEELVCNLPNTSKLFFFKDTAWTVTADKTKLPFKEFAEAMYEEMGIYAKTAAFYAAESY